MTNDEFATRVGCHYSYASRLRRGERMPSVPLLFAIIVEFDLPETETLKAFRDGQLAFSAYLRREVFDKTSAVTPVQPHSNHG